MMNFLLECQKTKHTGFLAAFISGGILAALVPVINMAVRAEMYTALPQAPVKILLDADWQMMAMLNILLPAAGACLLYHTEYADNALQKMCTLPCRESSLFFAKFFMLASAALLMLVIEAAGILFCSMRWFAQTDGVFADTAANFGYAFLLLLPSMLLALFFASACPNMWISLGVSVICIFTASMLPQEHLILSLFPFAMPFQVYTGASTQTVQNFLAAAAAETALFSLLELLFLKIRRSFR